MRLFGWLFRVIWGDDVDPSLRPMLAVGLASSLAGASTFTFIGIWAINELGASGSQLGVAFLLSALVAAAVGYLAGHVSDHIGRRPLMLAGGTGLSLVPLALLAAGHHVLLALGFLVFEGVFSALGHAANSALVADLVPPERVEKAYAGMRVANNLGVTLGPPVGGALLLTHDWHVFFVGVAALGALSWLISYRLVPHTGAYAPESPPERGSFAVIRRDHAFLLYLGSAILASMTYVGFETLLPISLTKSHGLDPAAWGFLVIVNPAMVTFLQLRLTRRVEHVPPALRLAVALPLMGLPFLFLRVSAAIPLVVLVILLFVIGEMLWIPTSQSVVAAFAPIDLRGAYMGAFGSSWAIAWALGPFAGLQVRDAFGDDTMWLCVAVVSLIAGASGAAAVRGRGGASVKPAVASAP